jgi:hypothetical protein
MDQWAKKVAELNMRCARCRSIARRSIRGELRTDTEQQHIEQHVRATLEATRNRETGGLPAKGGGLDEVREASVARFYLGQKELKQT